MNFVLLIPAFATAIYYPQVAVICGLFASLGTMASIYILPISCYLKSKWIALSQSTEIRQIIDSEEINTLESIDRIKTIQEKRNAAYYAYFALFIACLLLVTYGVGIVVLNLVSVIRSIVNA